MAERIFRPLGMQDTGFVVPRPAPQLRHPLPNDPISASRSPRGLAAAGEFECGGGRAASTAADYSASRQMLLNGGTLEGTRCSPQDRRGDDARPPAPDIANNVTKTEPRADFGFGVTVAVRREGGVGRGSAAPACSAGTAPTARCVGGSEGTTRGRVHGEHTWRQRALPAHGERARLPGDCRLTGAEAIPAGCRPP